MPPFPVTIVWTASKCQQHPVPAQGLQNLLANATGNAAPPIIIGLYAKDAYTTSYLIASAFIVSGIATILTVIRFRIPGQPC